MALRFRKNDHAHNLLVAVGRWVKANGGKPPQQPKSKDRGSNG